MIIVLAGRRIDTDNAKSIRFPLSHRDNVRQELSVLFETHGATTLVSSGACGADLLAQDVARELGMERHLVLPFNRETFRETSVVDRPGDWGPLFDVVCDDAEKAGRLTILEFRRGARIAYSAATAAMIKKTIALKQVTPGTEVLAVMVWEGRPRRGRDETALFGRRAFAEGFEIKTIYTR